MNPAVAAWKENGGKVAGYFCTHVPTEVIMAAGLLPFRMPVRAKLLNAQEYATIKEHLTPEEVDAACKKTVSYRAPGQ